jgi:hypothetical protein
MGTRSTFLGLLEVTAVRRCPALSDWPGGHGRPGNSPSTWTVPETDTGGLVEHTQAFERTVLKELGKLPP